MLVKARIDGKDAESSTIDTKAMARGLIGLYRKLAMEGGDEDTQTKAATTGSTDAN